MPRALAPQGQRPHGRAGHEPSRSVEEHDDLAMLAHDDEVAPAVAVDVGREELIGVYADGERGVGSEGAVTLALSRGRPLVHGVSLGPAAGASIGDQRAVLVEGGEVAELVRVSSEPLRTSRRA